MDKALNDTINGLNSYSEMIATAPTEEKFNELGEQLSEKIRKINLRDIHPLIINALCNNVCGKILTLYHKKDASRPANELLAFMLDRSIMPPIYRSLFKQLRFAVFPEALVATPSFGQGSPEAELAMGSLTSVESINTTLNALLNLNAKAERYLNKNFGYCLLDLNGDFMWVDPNCEKFFELRAKEIANKNFFDLMIPFSKNFLIGKFGEELFRDNNFIGSMLTFSYVIYSKNSMNKFLKCLKRLNIKTEAQFREKLRKKDSDDAIYHQYLKALSSRATLVLLRFTKNEFRGIVTNPKFGVNVTKSLRDLVADALPPEPSCSELDDADEDSSRRSGQRRRRVAADSEFQQTMRRIRDMNDRATDGHEDVVRNAVLIETRLALNVPSFDYRKLCTDERVKQFEEKILKKLTKRVD